MDTIRDKFKSYFNRPSPVGSGKIYFGSYDKAGSSAVGGIVSSPEAIENGERVMSAEASTNNESPSRSHHQQPSPQSPAGWNLFGNRRSSSQSPARSPSAPRASSSSRNPPLDEVNVAERSNNNANEIDLSSAVNGTPSGNQEDYAFPTDEPCPIRFVPYNPYFPTIEKHLYNVVPVNIGRYQRHNQQDDPYNEGIYYRSTVISRKHATIIFKDGHVRIL
jgi:hypothetical protein